MKWSVCIETKGMKLVLSPVFILVAAHSISQRSRPRKGLSLVTFVWNVMVFTRSFQYVVIVIDSADTFGIKLLLLGREAPSNLHSYDLDSRYIFHCTVHGACSCGNKSKKACSPQFLHCRLAWLYVRDQCLPIPHCNQVPNRI